MFELLRLLPLVTRVPQYWVTGAASSTISWKRPSSAAAATPAAATGAERGRETDDETETKR